MEKKNSVYLLLPEDRSVEAYKEWILALLLAITGKKSDGSNTPEEEWEKRCKEFWKEE